MTLSKMNWTEPMLSGYQQDCGRNIAFKHAYGRLLASKDKITNYPHIIKKIVFWLIFNGLLASKAHN